LEGTVFRHLFTGERLRATRRGEAVTLSAGEIFQNCPVAMLAKEPRS
jgi:hypothetical protein